MTGETLRDRVQQALAAIPHGGDCPQTWGGQHCENCCGRQYRIAQRVTAAIEAAARWGEGIASGRDWRERAVRALASQDEER